MSETFTKQFNEIIELAKQSRNQIDKNELDEEKRYSKIYEICKSERFKELFYDDLHIIGGAFSVLETTSQEALLLFRKTKNHNPDVKESDFFWFPYENEFYSKENAKIIDTQFITTRESQKLDQRAPDFLQFLSEDNKEKPYHYKEIINDYIKYPNTEVLYCDNSEILIFLLSYIELVNTLITGKNGDFYFPENSIEKITIHKNEIFIETLLKDYSFFEEQDNYLELYKNLSLHINGQETILYERLIERIKGSKLLEANILQNDSIENLPNIIKKCLEKELKENFSSPENTSYEDSVGRIHKYARFPIIPYLTIFLKRKSNLSQVGIAHIVFPLWKTFITPPRVKLSRTKNSEIFNDVVFALLTVNDDHYNIKNSEEKKITKNFKKQFSKLHKVFRTLGDITADTVFYDKFFNKNIRKEAFKAALNQILLRNNAHNLGSHVSYRTTNKQIKKRTKGMLLNQNMTDAKIDNFIQESEFVEWLDYFSEKLDLYEICRNEYLSDLDLSPKTLKFYQDLILPFCENLFALDNIAAGEQLNYEEKGVKNRLRIECTIDEKKIWAEYPNLRMMQIPTKPMVDTKISYPDFFPYLLEKKDKENPFDSAINNRKIKGEEDVEICIHSEQAIYSILENFIRNSAKHGENDNNKLIVTLDLKKSKCKNHFDLTISDNRSKASLKVLEDISDKISKSLLKASGEPARENWGFADMKINSYLLFHSYEKIDETTLQNQEKRNFELVVKLNVEDDFCLFNKVKTKLNSNTKYEFGYRLKISKPKKILWIGDIDEKIKSRFIDKGLEHVEKLDKTSLKKNASTRMGLTSFQFAIINTSFDEEDYLKYLELQEMLPGRVIVLKGNDSLETKPSVVITTNQRQLEDFDTFHKLLIWCWKTWLLRKSKEINLFLYFENINVAQKWASEDISLGSKIELNVINYLEEYSIDTSHKTNIFYDHHGEGVNKESLNGKKCLDTSSLNFANFCTEHSIINFGGGSEDFSSLNYPPVQNQAKELLLFQRIDAATSNIFVVDERISELSQNKNEIDFKGRGRNFGTRNIRLQNWATFAYGKLFVIHEFINKKQKFPIGKEQNEDEKLALQISEDENIRLITKIKNIGTIDKDLSKDILIIHRSYLNKSFNSEITLELLSKVFGSVFITSGGGYPHNLKDKWRFIPFSVLQSCIGENLAKNKLNNVLRTNIK